MPHDEQSYTPADLAHALQGWLEDTVRSSTNIREGSSSHLEIALTGLPALLLRQIDARPNVVHEIQQLKETILKSLLQAHDEARDPDSLVHQRWTPALPASPGDPQALRGRPDSDVDVVTGVAKLRQAVWDLVGIFKAIADEPMQTVEGSGPPLKSNGMGKASTENTPNTTDWMTVSQVHKKWEINKGEISRACDSGAIHSFGHRRARRIEPASAKVWVQNKKRGDEIRLAKPPEQSQPTESVSSGLCNNCGVTFTLRNGLGSCSKCGSNSFEPLRRNVAQPTRKHR